MNFCDFCDESNLSNNYETNQQFDYGRNYSCNNINHKNVENNGQKTQINQQNTSIFKQNNQMLENDGLKQDIQNRLNKYQNMSENQLQAELFKEATRQKQNGNLDEKKLNDIKNTLSPMLDESQKNRLEDLIKMLR